MHKRSLLILMLSLSAVLAGVDDPIRRLRHSEATAAAIHKVMPPYPSIARQLNIAGRVELEVQIDTEGRVDGVRAVSGNPVLTKAAIEAVRSWRFSPFRLNDQPIRAIAELSFMLKP